LQRRLPKGEKLIYTTFSTPIDTTGIAGYVATTGRQLSIADVYDLPATEPYGFSQKIDQSAGYRTGSMFTVPLKTARGDILGILQIINALDESGRVIAFSEQDQQILVHFANIAAVALERAQMTRTILLRMIRMSELHDPKETGAMANPFNRVGPGRRQ
jgi:GAF domain-containing protein